MSRSVCLKKLKALVAAAHDHVANAYVAATRMAEACREVHDGGNADEFAVVEGEAEKAMAALQVALEGELGVAPPGYDPDLCEEHDIDPNGVACECPECRPARVSGS